MSAPRKIWTYPNGKWGSHRLGWPTADLYHHDDVVRELAGLLLEAEKAMPSDLRTYRGLRGRISAALAKIAQEE